MRSVRVAVKRRKSARQKSRANNRLREILLERGISQRELSRMSGVTQPHISVLLSGERRAPGVRTALKIAKALDVSVEEIWGDAIHAERGE